MLNSIDIVEIIFSKIERGVLDTFVIMNYGINTKNTGVKHAGRLTMMTFRLSSLIVINVIIRKSRNII